MTLSTGIISGQQFQLKFQRMPSVATSVRVISKEPDQLHGG